MALVEVPYDSGRRGVGLGRGPTELVAGGARERLDDGGADVRHIVVQLSDEGEGEGDTLRAYVAVVRAVAGAVRAAAEAGAAPVVLAGNCGATAGVVAGLSGAVRGRLGVLWLDAHADLHTPSTTTSGYLDGMSAAMLTGRCAADLLATVPGWEPLRDDALVLVGVRDVDPGEGEAVAGIAQVPVEAVRTGGLAPVLDGLDVDALHLHVDLDVHDVAVGRANAWASAGGLTAEEVRGVVRAVAESRPVVSATLASWDPALDDGHRMRDVGLELLGVVGEVLRRA